MEYIKKFVYDHFELILIFMMVLAIEVIIFYTKSRLPYLNFFYLPVLISGYYLGRKSAIETSIISILLTFFYIIAFDTPVFNALAFLESSFGIFIWAGFLILSAILVGKLYEEKEKQVGELKFAYIGILEILSKYLESYDRYTQGHSVRVAKLATEIAIAMKLPRSEVENIKAAALLHDIGKADVSLDLIKKSAQLTKDEKELVDQHTEKGGNLLRLVGSVLDDAIPLVLAHHDKYCANGKINTDLPLGAGIISVADTYDALVTDRPYHAAILPWQALDEIDKESGHKFDPEIVKMFKLVVTKVIDNEITSISA